MAPRVVMVIGLLGMVVGALMLTSAASRPYRLGEAVTWGGAAVALAGTVWAWRARR